MSYEQAPTLSPFDWEKYGPKKWLERFPALFCAHGITNVSEVYSRFSKQIYEEIMISPYMRKYVTDELKRHMAELVARNTEKNLVLESKREVKAKLNAHAELAAAYDRENPEHRERLDQLKPRGFGERWPPAGL